MVLHLARCLEPWCVACFSDGFRTASSMLTMKRLEPLLSFFTCPIASTVKTSELFHCLCLLCFGSLEQRNFNLCIAA